jgi:hypothetical protein
MAASALLFLTVCSFGNASPHMTKRALDIASTNYSTTTLTPIPAPEALNQDGITPSTGVSLFYGAINQTSGLVNMTLSTNTVAVALEYIDSVASVDCGDDSLTIAFNNTDSFSSALAEWSLDETLIMITNHMGDCDTEFERGFFQVANITSESSTNTIIAYSSPANISTISG